jgi:cysteine synthase A
MKIYDNLTELIGGTPLVALKNYGEKAGAKARIAAKVEYFNPAGSVKDRAARAMIDDAEAKGLIKPGATLIEPTSGNTGIGLALIAAVRGYKLILTMPETMSVERRKLLTALGAELVLTEGAKGMRGAIEKADALHESIPGSFIPGQFVNPANPKAHFTTTGPELIADTDGTIGIFVAGVGTGGTITGTGRALKAYNKNIQIVAVEPADSPVLSGGKSGPHALQGIGAGFVPDIYDKTVVDRIMTISKDDAYAAARLLAKAEGMLVGISSGAALSAATQLAKLEENADKLIVVLLPDTGDRYLSTDLF